MVDEEYHKWKQRPLEPEEIELWRNSQETWNRYFLAFSLLARILGWGSAASLSVWASHDTIAKIWKAFLS